MKVKEVIERECCQQGDLLPLFGDVAGDLMFCKHCGIRYRVSLRMGTDRKFELSSIDNDGPIKTLEPKEGTLLVDRATGKRRESNG